MGHKHLIAILIFNGIFFNSISQDTKPLIVLDPIGHTAKIQDLHFIDNGDKLVSVSNDKTIRIWDTNSGELIKKYESEIGKGYEGVFYASAVSKNDKLLAVGGLATSKYESNYIVIVDLEKEIQFGTAVGHTETISAIDFSSDSRYMVTGDDMGDIFVWDVQKGGVLSNINKFNVGRGVADLTFSNTKNEFVVSTQSSELLFFNLDQLIDGNTATVTKKLKKHKLGVEKVKFSAKNNFMLTAANDENYLESEVFLWNNKGEILAQIPLGFAVSDISFSYDDKFFAVSSSKSGTVQVYDMNYNGVQLEDIFEKCNEPISALVFSPKSANGKDYTLATSNFIENHISVWSAISGTDQVTIQGKGSVFDVLLYGLDNKLYFSDSQESEIKKCFNLSSFSVENVEASISQIPTVKSRLAISQINDYELKLSNNKYIAVDPNVDGRILSYAIDNYGNVIVGCNFTLKLFGQNNSVLKEFRGHLGGIRAVAFSSDGKYLFSSSEDQSIIIWNLEEISGIPSIYEVLSQIPEEKDFIVKSLSDNYGMDSILYVPKKDAWELVINELKSKKVDFYKNLENWYEDIYEVSFPFLNLFISNDDEWVSWDNDGYFYCSDKGDQYFGWHFNNGRDKLADFYPASQYFDLLFKPVLIQNSLNSGIRIEKLMEQTGQKPFDFSKLSQPSFARIQILDMVDEFDAIKADYGTYSTKEKSIKLKLYTYHKGSGVKELNVYRNNKLIKTINDHSLNKVNNDGSDYLYTEVDIENGENQFAVSAINFGKVESRRYSININYVGDPILTSDLYMIAIGINDYKNESFNLNYAYSDASAFVEKMQMNEKVLYNNVNVISLYDENATKENILNAFKETSEKTKPNDVFIFYYAGHGQLRENEDYESEFYLVPHEVTSFYDDNQNLTTNGITTGELISNLTSIDCSSQLILLDACKSGSAIDYMAMRSVGEREKKLRQLKNRLGVTLISASGSQQYAKEFKELGHGVFTYSILKAMEGDGDILIKDNKLSVKELDLYLLSEIPKLVQKYNTSGQSPNSFLEGVDFVISTVK